MRKKSNLELFICSVLIIFVFSSTIINYSRIMEIYDNKDNSRELNEIKCPNTSYYNNSMNPISINGSAANNWLWASSQPWCSGSGIWDDPYIIENVCIDARNSGNGIEIINTTDYFIIRNVTITNSSVGGFFGDAGIQLALVSNGTIFQNNLSDNRRAGILLIGSNNNSIIDNFLFNNSIYLISSNNNTIRNNTLKNADVSLLGFGSSCDYNEISLNNITDGSIATSGFFDEVSYLNISNNLICNGIIDFKTLTFSTVSDNKITNGGIIFGGVDAESEFDGPLIDPVITNNVNTSNLVNGKPIYFYSNQTNLGLANFTNAGQVILGNCSFSVIKDLSLFNVSGGISLLYCKNITVENINISLATSYDGIYIQQGENLTLISNNLNGGGVFIDGKNIPNSLNIDTTNKINNKLLYYYENKPYLRNSDVSNAGQLILYNCSHAKFSNLDLSNGSRSISQYGCNNNTFYRINMSHNARQGFYMYFSNNNNLTSNLIQSNEFTGIILCDKSQNNTISNNNITQNKNYGIYSWGSNNPGNLNTTISNNNISYNTKSGVSLFWTPESTIRNNVISNNGMAGMDISAADSGNITENTVSRNKNDGIQIGGPAIAFAEGCTITRNNISNNKGLGMIMESNSYNNTIFLNNFSGNDISAQDDGEFNNWDNGTIGNYWDVYIGTDSDDNGIGDTYYSIPGIASNNDTKPLFWDAPYLNITFPDNYAIFGKVAPYYNATVEEGRGNTFWYEFNETGGKSSIALAGSPNEDIDGFFDQGLWNALSNGTRLLRVFINDSRNYITSINISIRVDKTDPIIAINIPSPFEIIGEDYPFYNITIIADNFKSAWYTLDGGSSNYTIIGATVGENTDIINDSAWDAIADDGIYLLNFYVNETSGNIINQSLWIEKDTTNPIINITNPLHTITITDTVPDYNYTASDNNLVAVWYSLNHGKNETVSGNGTIIADYWNGLPDGTVIIRFYANDSAGNIGWDEIWVIKETTTNNGGNGNIPPGGFDPILSIIIIAVIATVALLSILIITKRSKKEMREKDVEIKSLKKQRAEITEDDILISKRKHICLVHKGAVEGISYICPQCNAYYCEKCYNVIKEAENECWSCGLALDTSKPIQKPKDKDIEEKIETEIEVKEQSKAPKLPKYPNKGLTTLPPKIAAPEKKLTIKAPLIEKVDETHVPKLEFPVIAPKKDAPLSIELLIKKFDDYIEEINSIIQKLEKEFSTGGISREEYIEKKTMLAKKLGEATIKRDQLRG